MSRPIARRLVPLIVVAAVVAVSTAFAPVTRASLVHAAGAMLGPPWISIEYPPSPYDQVTREALLLVNAYHHFTPAGLPVSGTAEGIVDGQRRSVRLTFQETSKQGKYALKKQWPSEGAWVLNLAVTQGEGEYNTAGALVTLDREGNVAGVTVPTRMTAGSRIRTPRRVTAAEVEAALQVRLAGR